MSNYVSINRVMQNACGVGARLIGLPMGVYRIGPASNGDWINPNNLVLTTFADRQQMKRLDPAFESQQRMETFWYELLIDNNPLLLGDVLISHDHVYNQGAQVVNFPTDQFIGFCMAAMPPIKHSLSARLDVNAQFYRPNLQPASEIGGVPYNDMTLPQELPIICSGGQFILGNVGDTASKIPIGTMPMNNSGNIYSVATANMPIQERRRVYVPPLSGFTLKAGDQMVTENGSRYVLLSNYFQDAGTVGGQYLAEKLVSGGV